MPGEANRQAAIWSTQNDCNLFEQQSGSCTKRESDTADRMA
jgi:hypothetical protein